MSDLKQAAEVIKRMQAPYEALRQIGAALEQVGDLEAAIAKVDVAQNKAAEIISRAEAKAKAIVDQTRAEATQAASARDAIVAAIGEAAAARDAIEAAIGEAAAARDAGLAEVKRIQDSIQHAKEDLADVENRRARAREEIKRILGETMVPAR